MRLAYLAAAIAGLTLSALRAEAQTAPQRTVRIVVPFAAGGSADVLARVTAQALATRWGQQVVIDNRLGAGGHIGAEHVARSPGDGQTLLLGSIGIQSPACTGMQAAMPCAITRTSAARRLNRSFVTIAFSVLGSRIRFSAHADCSFGIGRAGEPS